MKRDFLSENSLLRLLELIKTELSKYAKKDDCENGLTPYIGDNGNWWIGETDTGTKAEGVDGKDGKDGHTPEKYVDYFTESDITDIANRALQLLPDYREVEH